MYARLPGTVSRGEIDRLFQRGAGALFPWLPDEARSARQSMATLRTLLAGLAPEDTFPGVDNLQADRQSFWLASRGLGKPFVTDPEFLASLDGDPGGGRKGTEVLAAFAEARPSLEILKDSLDRALAATAAEVGIPGSWQPRLTVRYRVIRYAPLRRPSAGIGLHPDGNVLSALVTDGPGLTLWRDAETIVEPPQDGTLVLPGSILSRWSEGHYEPTFHRVEVGRDAEPKFSMVAFLNFPDRTELPCRGEPDGGRTYFNDIRASKVDDMDREGDLSELWRRLSAQSLVK